MALLMALFHCSACAWTDVASTRESAQQDTAAVEKFREIIVDVQKKKGACFREQVCNSVYHRINECVVSKYPGKYKSVTVETADIDALYIRVLITRYDDGIFYARSTFSDLVTMRIDGEVTISEKKTNKTLAVFKVEKEYVSTLRSGLQKIGELEPEFAKEVIEGIAEKGY